MSVELLKAFEQFKQANDERLKQIEAKGHADPLLEAKVDKANADITDISGKIQARIDEMEKKINRVGLFGPTGEPIDEQQAMYRKDYLNFLRKGEITNAMTEGSNADGGYAVPIELDRSIQDQMLNINAMRRIANVVTVSTPNYQKLINIHGSGTGWVGETDARTATNSPQLAQITPFMGELYSNPTVSQWVIDDVFFNLEQWLTGELASAFAVAEGTAFTSGSGTKQPKGFLSYTTVATADGARAFGSLQYVPTGVAADFKATTPGDNLFDLVFALKAGHRNGASFQMSKLMLAAIRKFKTTTNEYLWVPDTGSSDGLTTGTPGTLLGYPVYENEDMVSAVAANALVIAFGNWKNGYTIVDRIGTRVLRDPYTNKPNIQFYVTKRVGGMVADSEAIKILKCSAA